MQTSDLWVLLKLNNQETQDRKNNLNIHFIVDDEIATFLPVAIQEGTRSGHYVLTSAFGRTNHRIPFQLKQFILNDAKVHSILSSKHNQCKGMSNFNVSDNIHPQHVSQSTIFIFSFPHNTPLPNPPRGLTHGHSACAQILIKPIALALFILELKPCDRHAYKNSHGHTYVSVHRITLCN